ncbi:reprolysin-like metallopeptidase [Chryseobacterium sp.]|uniref:reprolysin-like metallopeptidase n=1 Tax=Chryseobacterium sp. TaxID=1871047 RepID=UPI00388EE245
MKRIITTVFCSLIGSFSLAQWTPARATDKSAVKPTTIKSYYKLDLAKIQSQLKNAQESGPNSRAIEISLPTLSGKVERFAIYSFPVMVKELADKYELGSYAGVGIDDPTKYVRFSVAPNDFQSTIIKGGEYEFISPEGPDKTIYSVHPKTNPNTDGKSFVCNTKEDPTSVRQLETLYKKGASFSNQPTNFAKSTDKKYRTIRLAISTTGEYTAFFGGQAQALAQVNATITRVNAVFEKDFALHINVQNYPQLIFTDATTDPYATVVNANEPPSSWNLSLQQTLTNVVTSANYDIGHLFGASGGGGNAGCIGCVCIDPTSITPLGKGAGITSPATGSINASATRPPSGDSFDIDYVAHELGHQLGANHTFSHNMQGSPVQMEPGSGSTIMGYAGITGASTDVQANSDPYFLLGSVIQVENNLASKTCDIETTIANNPPVIAPMQSYSIPKGTAFVLTASATDPENDPLTYTWEEFDNTSEVINKNNLGTTMTGATFRSLPPSTSPTRYFPKLQSVLNGVLNNGNNLWEAVSQVARATTFTVHVRDNNPNVAQQQSEYDGLNINVGNDGPFKVNSQYANVGVPTPVLWDVANTNAAPYNVANVKIDYTTDNGNTWTVLSALTPNDGSESFTFPTSMNGQIIKLRISAINNVFYAIGAINVAAFSACDGTAPLAVTASSITSNGATITWSPIANATYNIRYRIVGQSTWLQTTSNNPILYLTGLSDSATYEVQVASVCSGTTGAYSASTNFVTAAIPYCSVASESGQYNYISNVTLANVNNTTTGSTYSNFTNNATLQANLLPNSTNTISVSLFATLAGATMNGMAAWIDFNRNGIFEANERVLNRPSGTIAVGTNTTTTSTFTVPSTAVLNTPLRMRVVTVLMTAASVGASIPDDFACGSFPNGEAEDYNVIVASPLSTNDNTKPQDGIQIYPNPAIDVIIVTKVSDKATFKIYNAAGQLVNSGTINDGKINVTSLIKGTYVISISDKNVENFSSKFIKK